MMYNNNNDPGEWMGHYPTEAALDRADDLDGEANEEEEKAYEALSYDVNDYREEEYQRAQYIEHMERAAELRRRANELRRTI